MLEDRLADRLVWQATAAGVTAFVALAPRAEVDLNRDEREIDPVLIDPPLPSTSVVQTVRSRGGIGLIPSRIAGAGRSGSIASPAASFRDGSMTFIGLIIRRSPPR